MYSKPFLIKSGVIALTLILSAGSVAATEAEQALNDWLSHQTTQPVWSARVVQTRHLPALVQPLSSTGRVWFDHSDRFRWELGDPPRTIAIRNGDHLRVAYPQLDRVEHYFDNGPDEQTLRMALELLEVGAPSSSENFFSRYRLVNAAQDTNSWIFELGPRDATIGRMIASVQVQVARSDFLLLSTEIEFRDGARLRNDFDQHQFPEQFAPDLFHLD